MFWLILVLLELINSTSYEILYAINCGSSDRTVITTTFFNYTSVNDNPHIGCILLKSILNDRNKEIHTRPHLSSKRPPTNKNPPHPLPKLLIILIPPHHR
jgi:hypothetical protein